LIVEPAVAAIVAGAIILPFQLNIRCHPRNRRVPLIAYQYWRDLRMLHTPRLAGILPPQWSGIRLKNGDHLVAGFDDG
jgi:hypothetical protein